MSQRRVTRLRVNVPDSRRAAGAAPAERCGKQTRSCECGPRGRAGHFRREHDPITGHCQHPGCRCTAFRPLPCLQPVMAGRAGCRYHGGKALLANGNANFVHGGRSKYLTFMQGRMQQIYAQAASDPELVSLEAELALVETRIAETLLRFERDLSGDRYAQLAAAYDAFQTAGKAGDPVGAAAAAADLRSLIDRGQHDAGLSTELAGQIELKRRLAEGQARILRDTYRMVSFDQVVQIFAQVVDMVKRNVKDPREVSAVVADLSRLIGPGVSAAIPTIDARELARAGDVDRRGT